jgi:hypothetical protein
MDSTVLTTALARLSNLQHLSLADSSQKPVNGSCLLGLAQLKQLTSLKLHGGWSNHEQPLKQLLAQPLPLRQLDIHFWHTGTRQMPALNMAALVQLQELTACMVLPEGSVLPLQLQQLQLGKHAVTAGSLSMVMPLQQLQRLTVLVNFQEQAPLLRLAQLPALQHLML